MLYPAPETVQRILSEMADRSVHLPFFAQAGDRRPSAGCSLCATTAQPARAAIRPARARIPICAGRLWALPSATRPASQRAPRLPRNIAPSQPSATISMPIAPIASRFSSSPILCIFTRPILCGSSIALSACHHMPTSFRRGCAKRDSCCAQGCHLQSSPPAWASPTRATSRATSGGSSARRLRASRRSQKRSRRSACIRHTPL